VVNLKIVLLRADKSAECTHVVWTRLMKSAFQRTLTSLALDCQCFDFLPASKIVALDHLRFTRRPIGRKLYMSGTIARKLS
jgi:hypothetical protein